MRYCIYLVTTTNTETDSNNSFNNSAITAVEIGKPKGGPNVKTLRQDRWWIQPTLTFIGLFLFVVYGSWAAIRNNDYYTANILGRTIGRNYLSPFYSPCIANNCQYTTVPILGSWYKLSPAIIILIFPMGFRLSCYYYRKAYYRSFWFSPPACAVKEPHKKYSGESKFPLIMNNIHRYFWYAAVLFAAILTLDAINAFRFPNGSIGMGLWTLVFVINAVLIWLYTLSCHSCRHLTGGRINLFSKAPIRHWFWKKVSIINPHHMLYAWLSLVWIAFTDFYVYLVASGTIHDPRFF